jgi:hypothetical protein
MSSEDIELFYVPDKTWTVIPHSDLEVYHEMGHVCQIEVNYKTGMLTFVDGGKWTVKQFGQRSEAEEGGAQKTPPMYGM